MRGQLTAVYTSAVGLIGAGLGPVTIGVLSDFVTPAWGGVATAMSITFFSCATLSCALLILGQKSYRRVISALC